MTILAVRQSARNINRVAPVVFDSTRRLKPSLEFGAGVPEVDRGAPANDVVRSVRRHYLLGRTAALSHGSETAPAGATDRETVAYARGYRDGSFDYNVAFSAGKTAALDDEPETVPAHYSDELAGCWISGYSEGTEMQAARWTALQADAEEMEAWEHLRRERHIDLYV